MMENGFDRRYPVRVVRFHGTSQIFVLNGHHRIACANAAGLTHVYVDFTSENSLQSWMTYPALLEKSSISYAGW